VATGSTQHADALDELAVRYRQLLHVLTSEAHDDNAVRELLAVRDHIAALVHKSKIVGSDITDQICALDTELRELIGRLTARGTPTLETLRDFVQPPPENWWWYEISRPSPLWTIGAVVFLTISISLVTDFARRLLSSDPDQVGILAIAGQAVLTVAAGSTFTEAGRRWIENALSRLGVRTQVQQTWKFTASACLLSLTLLLWWWLPARLAVYYNDRAYGEVGNKEPAAAIRNYERAIRLDRRLQQAHFNLGELYEAQQYAYDDAAIEYQKAVVTNPLDLRPYSNLARLLILDGKQLSALRVLDKAVAKIPADPSTQKDEYSTFAALYKNRASAEFELGFDTYAEADARVALQFVQSSKSGPIHCILGKIYTRMGKKAEANAAWQHIRELVAARDREGATSVAEPDCFRLAGTVMYEKQ
jgi:tetratricopeptide (TPR) repeat protein